MSATVLGINRGSAEGEVSRRGTERRTEQIRTLVYEVEVGSKSEGLDTVLSALGLPKIGDVYNYMGQIYSDLKCRKLSAKQREELPILWDVTATFEPDIEEEAEVEIDFEIIRVPIVGSHSAVTSTYSPGLAGTGGLQLSGVEKYTVPVQNSAGQPPPIPPEGDEGCMILRVSRNEFVRELEGFARLNNSVNAQPFMGAKPRQWRMFVSAKPIQNHFQNKWRVSYTCHYRRKTWDFEMLDEGTAYLNAGVLTPNKDAEGNIVTKNLDGAGGLLAAGAERVFLRYQWLRPELWPDLEQTVNRYYSDGGGAGGGPGAGVRRREAAVNRGLAKANRQMQKLGFIA